MSKHAPIILFTYNRPDHTRQVIEALALNSVAAESDLFIYCDGARSEVDLDQVQKVQDYARTVTGFSETHVIIRERNYGLAANITDGVTTIVNQYGKAIVLEDDIVVLPQFLDYMNQALEKYEKEEKVMSVCAYTMKYRKKGLPDSYFLPWFDCLGWAVWKRSWNLYEKNTEKVIREFTKRDIWRLNYYGTDKGQWKQVLHNKEGIINTWAIFMSAAVVKNDGLVLYSQKSLCRNIGFDGSGENSEVVDYYCADIPEEGIVIKDGFFPYAIQANERAIESVRRFNKSVSRRILWNKCRRFIHRLVD